MRHEADVAHSLWPDYFRSLKYFHEALPSLMFWKHAASRPLQFLCGIGELRDEALAADAINDKGVFYDYRLPARHFVVYCAIVFRNADGHAMLSSLSFLISSLFHQA